MAKNNRKYSNSKYSLDEFRENVKSLVGENLKFMYGLVKGISLTASTIVIISLFINAKQPNIDLAWLLLINSWLVVMVTHDAVVIGTLFFVHIPKSAETLITFALVCLEFLLFVTCYATPFLSQISQEKLPDEYFSFIWFAIYGLYTLISSLMIIHGRIMLHRYSDFYTAEMKSVLDIYKKTLKVQTWWTVSVGLSSLLIFIWFSTLNYSNFILAKVVSIIYLILIVAAFILQHISRNKIEDEIYPNT